MTGGSEGNFEHTAEGDRNSAANPRSSEGEHKEKSVAVGDGLAEDRDVQREAVPPGQCGRLNRCGHSILRPQDGKNRASSTRNKPGSPGDPIMVEDEDTDSSGDGTSSEEQVGNRVSLRTSPTSVGGLKTG